MVGRVDVLGLTWRPYGRRAPILRDLHLVVPAGQRVLLAGPSGSGKSTLLRALAGALQVAEDGELSGGVTIDGNAPGSRPGQVGLVLQEPGAGVVAATIGRDVAFGLENTGVPRSQMPSRVAAALAAVRLDLPRGTPTYALSGGETQRLAIAGALALQPALLLLDEPTAMLDPDNAAAVRACVAEVARARSLTTMVVEHRLGPWVDQVDRLVVLGADGDIVADGDPDEVLAEHGDRLAEQGIWVPGRPDPLPVALPAGLFADPVLAPNESALRTEAATVSRRVTLVDGSTRSTLAVLDESVAARSGQVLALVGPSGCGKSTLLLALGGLIGLSSGAVTAHRDLAPTRSTGAEGRDPRRWTSPETARVLAWVPQWASSTLVARTVLDEVMTTPRALGQVESEAATRARSLLDVLGLGGLELADPRHLSGGEQRRLAMASAVVHQPAVVLADEPTVGQDRATWAAVLGLLQGLREAGSAVVVTTHDDAVTRLADRVHPMVRPAQPPPAPAVRRSLAARAGPLALLFGCAAAIPAGVLAPGWRAGLLVLAVQLALTVLALAAPGDGPPPPHRSRRLLLRLAPGLVGAVSVGWSTWLLGGHDLDLAYAATVRVVLIVLPSAALVPFVDPGALGDHCAQRLHLPDRPVVAAAAALQRVQTFGDTWAEISRARRVRGIGSGRSPRAVLAQASALTFGMLVRSLQAAAQLAVAMDARGFATAYRRTWLAPAPWRRSDTLLSLGALLPATAALVLRGL